MSRHHRSNTMTMSMAGAISASPVASTPISSQKPSDSAGADSAEQQQQLAAHLEQVRVLVMGMDQRLQGREDKLKQQIKKAEQESAKFERLRKEVAADA